MTKALSKTQKKLDNKIRLELTRLCEDELKNLNGFQWITHQADYSNFPASLLIICVFDSEENKRLFVESAKLAEVHKQMHSRFLKIGVVIKKIAKQVMLDSEEMCECEHEGNWNRRLKTVEGRAVPRSFPIEN